MALTTLSSIPHKDTVISPARSGVANDPSAWKITTSWLEFLSRLQFVVGLAPTRIGSIALLDQGASISDTDFSGGVVPAGDYRISFYARISRAATVSSSLTLIFKWTDGAVTKTFTGTPITGNTTDSFQSGTLFISSDTDAPITYATTYVTNGATTMLYKLNAIIERVKT